jgi:hypothetical protein
MRRNPLHALIPVLAVALVATACGGSQGGPTRPDALAGRNLIPDAPLNAPSPSPTPDVTGTLPSNPGGGGGGGSAVDFGTCGAPTPPPISRLSVRVHTSQPDRNVLDATPLVGPDPAYCALVGYTDGRLFCAVRPEGHPERSACEALRVGRASDTGRIGPTWTAEGRPCQGRTEGPSCLNHPDNQFLVFAYGSGTFQACAGRGACGQATVR